MEEAARSCSIANGWGYEDCVNEIILLQVEIGRMLLDGVCRIHGDAEEMKMMNMDGMEDLIDWEKVSKGAAEFEHITTELLRLAQLYNYSAKEVMKVREIQKGASDGKE